CPDNFAVIVDVIRARVVGVREIKGFELSVPQEKAVLEAGRVVVSADDFSLRVDGQRSGLRCARKQDVEISPVGPEKAPARTTGPEGIEADDISIGVDAEGTGRDRARNVDARKHPAIEEEAVHTGQCIGSHDRSRGTDAVTSRLSRTRHFYPRDR